MQCQSEVCAQICTFQGCTVTSKERTRRRKREDSSNKSACLPHPPDHGRNQFAAAESLCFQGECDGSSAKTRGEKMYFICSGQRLSERKEPEELEVYSLGFKLHPQGFKV